MFDTLYIGTSGLLGNAKGLKIVSNNLANVNTPGFKSSQLQFADVFSRNGGATDGSGQSAEPGGKGMNTLGAALNFRPGSEQSTGNPLDQVINGNGLFTVRRENELLYTRAGDFRFNGDEVLTNSAGDHVQGLDSGGKLVDVTLKDLASSAPKATTTVSLRGNLTSVVAIPPVDAVVSNIPIIDAAGGSRAVNLSLRDAGGGSYTVTVTDAAAATTTPAPTPLGTGTVRFANGVAVAGADSVTFQYATAGVAAFAVKLDFAKTEARLTPTTLSFDTQDGHVAGVRTNQSIDADGTVSVSYSNGQTRKGARLALANFSTEKDLVQAGGGAFSRTAQGRVQYGYAGVDAFGSLVSGRREGSNVDLAEEFSNLIVMQRGYQAASHVISTTNDMIQQLFDMKGNR